MKEKELRTGFIVILLLIAILFVLFFIGDVVIGEKGSNLCSIFFGCIMAISGLYYTICIILLNNFGIKINAKIISRNIIYRTPLRLRGNVSYDIEGKNYTNWVILKNSDELNQLDTIPIIVLRKHPKLIMSKYQNNLSMIIIMLILAIGGFYIIFINMYNLFMK